MSETVICPDCKEPITIKGENRVGDVIECLNCGAEMEIISLTPLKVELIEEEK